MLKSDFKAQMLKDTAYKVVSFFLAFLGWVSFFVWLSVSLFFHNLPKGYATMGLGVIVLVGTAARKIFGIAVSGYWLTIGIVFLLAGTGEAYEVNLPLSSFALIICGILLLFNHHR